MAYYCNTCWDGHEHPLIKVRDEKDLLVKPIDVDEEKKMSENQILKEVDAVGFEDKIGEIKTWFKYWSVPKNDFALTNEDILFLDDWKLNNLVPLKKYRPFWDDESKTNLHRVWS